MSLIFLHHFAISYPFQSKVEVVKGLRGSVSLLAHVYGVFVLMFAFSFQHELALFVKRQRFHKLVLTLHFCVRIFCLCFSLFFPCLFFFSFSKTYFSFFSPLFFIFFNFSRFTHTQSRVNLDVSNCICDEPSCTPLCKSICNLFAVFFYSLMATRKSDGSTI